MSYCVHKVPRNGTPVYRLWLFPRCAKGTDDVSINRPLRLRGMTSLRGRENFGSVPWFGNGGDAVLK